MLFRNLTCFRFPDSLDFDRLDDALAECVLKPVSGLELSSRGFVPPFGPHGVALSHRVGQALWLTVGGEDKVLPAAVVNDLLAKQLIALEEQQGRRPSARIRRQMKEDLIADLVPRAFVRPVRTDVMIDLAKGLCMIDTASRKNAETVVSEIRRALGSFPALPLNAELAPRAVLTGWIAGDRLPQGLTLGDECELKDAADHGAVVKCLHQDLHGEEIAKHLEAGKQVTQLALLHDDHLGFVLGEDLTLRKLKFLDGAVAHLESSEREDILAELDARFALMSAVLRRVFETLGPVFNFNRA